MLFIIPANNNNAKKTEDIFLINVFGLKSMEKKTIAMIKTFVA
ncbi:hypothetical protein LCGC14_2862770 [marine sediment metagenome]|uniref:Uncharacterized protein n=1 Tax=marine sediment metagenome TaxID=412755 RepID=A0A0F8XFV0_9ZZZZ